MSGADLPPAEGPRVLRDRAGTGGHQETIYAPSSLAVDVARRFEMALVDFL
jgi:hypothetical protein